MAIKKIYKTKKYQVGGSLRNPKQKDQRAKDPTKVSRLTRAGIQATAGAKTTVKYGLGAAGVVGVGVPAAVVTGAVAAGLSAAKTGAVLAGTAAVSTPLRAVQGSLGTTYYSGKLLGKYYQRRSAKQALEQAGLFNAERMKKRLTRKTGKIDALKQQQEALELKDKQAQLGDKPSTLGFWDRQKQKALTAKIDKKTQALEKYIQQKTGRVEGLETQLSALKSKGKLGFFNRRKQSRLELEKQKATTYAELTAGTNTAKSPIERAKALLGEGEGSIKTVLNRRKAAHNAKVDAQRQAKTAGVDAGIVSKTQTLGTHQLALESAKVQLESNQKELVTAEQAVKDFGPSALTSKLPNGNYMVNGKEYTFDELKINAEEARKKLTLAKDTRDLTQKDFDMKQGLVKTSTSELEALQKQKATYQTIGKTSNNLIASYERKKENLRQTKKNLGRSVSQLLPIQTAKNIGKAVGRSLKQDVSLAERGLDKLGKATGIKRLQLSNVPLAKTNKDGTITHESERQRAERQSSFSKLGASMIKSATSLGRNALTAYRAVGDSPASAKFEAFRKKVFRGFPEQARFWKKIEKEKIGAFQEDWKSIQAEYNNLKPGQVVPSELRNKHNALMSKIGISRNFINEIAVNAGNIKAPTEIEAESNLLSLKVKDGNEIITFPKLSDINNKDFSTKLTESLTQVATVINTDKSKTAAEKRVYINLYNHLRSLKNYKTATQEITGAEANRIIASLDKIVPSNMKMLPSVVPVMSAA